MAFFASANLGRCQNSVALRHTDVSQNNIILVLIEQLQGFSPVASKVYMLFKHPKVIERDSLICWVIFNEKHAKFLLMQSRGSPFRCAELHCRSICTGANDTTERFKQLRLFHRLRYASIQVAPHILIKASRLNGGKEEHLYTGYRFLGPNQFNNLNKQRDHLFTFLDHEGVDATNNLAERQLRPAVIARKISCGNKTPKPDTAIKQRLKVLRFFRLLKNAAQVHCGAFDGGFDFFGAYWLAEIVIHTRRQATVAVFFHCVGGHGDNIWPFGRAHA